MTRHFNEDADAIAVQAYEHAIRLGHPYLGGEHLLLALAAAGQPAGAVLREHGVTPERTEAEIVPLSGGGLSGDLDRDALATVGVDIDAVRATTEASFGQEALTRAARAVYRRPRWFDPGEPPSLDGTAPSSPSAPVPGRPSSSPAGRRRHGTPPSPPASRTSHLASSPSARDWCPRSCRHSARPGRY